LKPIFLIGFMCSGKTTLGRALAKRLRCRFVDLDEAIEAEAGMPVADIFRTFGEAEFRRREADMVEQICRLSDVVVATGGGTPCRPGMMERLNSAGLTVALRARRSRLYPRLMEGRAGRPLLASVKTESDLDAIVRPLMAAREPFYSLAAKQFDSSLLETTAEINASVEKFLEIIRNKSI